MSDRYYLYAVKVHNNFFMEHFSDRFFSYRSIVRNFLFKKSDGGLSVTIRYIGSKGSFETFFPLKICQPNGIKV